MFDRLSDGFNGVFRKLSGRAEISEKNVRDAMEEVETALLEADVHYDVAKQFCKDVMQDAIGREVTKSLKPGQEMIGIVNDRLIELLGGQPSEDGMPQEPPGIMKVAPGPTVVMMCGLQGSGKTTTCGKLAAHLKKQGRSVMLCAADLQRPAAVEQLGIVAEQADTKMPGNARVHFYSEPDKVDEYGKAVGVAVKVCENALKEAKKQDIDVLILDTAGRLHVNDELMGELRRVNSALTPHQIFLVVDAMTGQDAVESAKAFHKQLEIDGVILSKFDSDTRGGAALSVKTITGAPIRFIGTGETLADIEPFAPDRIASRILGMGDMLSLVEKAQQEVSEEEAERLQEKMTKGEMNMDDFLKQLKTLRRMGPMKQLLGMLPGVGQALKNIEFEEKELDRVEAMIGSMTKDEREKPKIIDNSRRRRIAKGFGGDQNRVGQVVKQFSMVSQMSKQMAGLGAGGKVGAVKQLAAQGGLEGMMPGLSGMPGMASRGSTKSAGSGKKRFKQRKKRK